SAGTATPVAQDGFSFGDFNLRLGTGVDTSSGKYGAEESTDIIYVPFIATLQYGHWTLQGTVPWVDITGPGVVVGAGDTSVTTDGAAAARQTVSHASGLGDVLGSLGYTFYLPKETFLTTTGEVKFPTGDRSRNLGTGDYDFTLEGDLFRQFGKFTAFM